MTPKENLQIAKMNKKLNRFFITSLSIFAIVVVLAFDNAGFKREIRAEMRGFRDLFEMHIKLSEKEQNAIKTAIENNRLNHSEVATKLLEKGIIKDIELRNGTIN